MKNLGLGNSGSKSVSGSPPKSNRILEPRPSLQKKFYRNPFITCWDTCKMSVYVYALSVSDKESGKMIQDLRKNPDRHQNLNDSSLGHTPFLHKISSKSIHNFWRYFVYEKWLHTYGHTYTHAHTHTHTSPAQVHNQPPLSEADYYYEAYS